MAADRESDTAAMSRASTVVGSEDGVRMRLAHGDDSDLLDATESTGLLDAAPPEDLPVRKDSWDGMSDFEGQPWWRRPSVRGRPV